MSELRRNGGADDGDGPADNVAKADDPTHRPNPEIRSVDQNADWPVDRRKVTAAQRHFIGIEKQAADSPSDREPVSTLSVDWKTGESADGHYPPPDSDAGRDEPATSDDGDDRGEPDDSSGDLDRTPTGNTPAERHSPYAEPPGDFNRDNSDLEARTLERTEDATGFSGFDDVKPGRRKSRGSWDKIVEKSGNVVKGVQDSADKLDHVFNPPRPTGQFVGSTPDPPQHITQQYAGHHVGDIAAAVTTVVIIAVDTSRKVHRKFDEWKDKNAGNG